VPAALWTTPCAVCVTPLPVEETVDAVVVEADDPAAVFGAGAFSGPPVPFEPLVVPPEAGAEAAGTEAGGTADTAGAADAAGAVPALVPPWAGKTETTWHATPPTGWVTSDPEPDEQAGVVPD